MSIEIRNSENIVNEESQIFSYKSLSSMVRETRGKRETWRNLFEHPEFKGHFEIEHNSTGGMKIKTKLTLSQLKTLFALYKKHVSSRLKAEGASRNNVIRKRIKKNKDSVEKELTV
jgi:hypothetical protein